MRTIIVCNMPTQPAVSPSATSRAENRPQKVMASEQLFGADAEIVIVHNGREYRLRKTQNGKLILTA